MHTYRSLLTATATTLLHVIAVAAVLNGLSSIQEKPAEPPVLEVQLAQPTVPYVARASVSEALPPLPEKKHSVPKQTLKHTVVPARPAKPQEDVVPAAPYSSSIAAPITNAESIPAAPAAPAAVQPAPAVAAPPVKMGPSIPASYAAGNRKPVYPTMSKRYEEQGTVMLRVLVRMDGTAGAVEIKSSSGYALLDGSAKDAVKTWHFRPATVGGKPVDEWFNVPIPFTLQN